MPDPVGINSVGNPPVAHVSSRARRSILIASGTLFAAGTVGSNIGPALVDENPVLVLLLASRNRNLFGSVPFIDPVPYAVIGFCRILLAAVVLFYLGRWYGERAIGWTERQVGDLPPIYKWFERAVAKAGWLLFILMPGSNLVCIMAGHQRVPARRFIPLICIGIVLKLIALWFGGKAFEDQIRSFLSWIEDYQWYVVAGLFLISFLQSARHARRDIPEIVHEIEHPTDDPSSAAK
jgi:membrane protein DedA with SNARE-associated domain